MLSILVIAALAAFSEPKVDTAAVYAAVLSDIRAEHPGVPIVLAETRTGVECMPHCGARFQENALSAAAGPAGTPRVHGAGVIRSLRHRELIDATCTVKPRVFGCLGYAGHIFVGLGEISGSPRYGPPEVKGAYWVQVALLVPCKVRCEAGRASPDGFGYWVLVHQQNDGSWRTGRRQPTFAL